MLAFVRVILVMVSFHINSIKIKGFLREDSLRTCKILKNQAGFEEEEKS